MNGTIKAGSRSLWVALAASAALVACGGGGGTNTASATAPTVGSGALRVALTDAPSCGYDQVWVTVERVRVHQSMDANDNDGGWVDIPVAGGPRKIDLLTLTNGVLAELGQTTLAAGQYTQIRLVLGRNGAGSPANSVVPTNGSETPMDTPSAMQSGLKLINGFTVQPGQLTDVVLDFDACKSIVQRGNGAYLLKPVIAMLPRTLSSIMGYVETGLTGVTVSAQKNGVVLRATQPNANGQFILAPVDPAMAPYDVVFSGSSLTSAVITGVPVAQDKTTAVSTVADPVKMPTSNTGVVSGKLLPVGAASAGGSVRALQAVSATTTVEVGHKNVDSATGAYSLTLPLAAPRLMAYSDPIISPLPLVEQAAAAAKYKLQASATGYVTSTGGEITLSNVPLTGQDFTLVPVGP